MGVFQEKRPVIPAKTGNGRVFFLLPMTYSIPRGNPVFRGFFFIPPVLFNPAPAGSEMKAPIFGAVFLPRSPPEMLGAD